MNSQAFFTHFVSAVFILIQLIAPKLYGQEKRLALIVGNDNYQEMSLQNAINDARAVERELISCGFEVLKIENADQLKLESELEIFSRRLVNYDVGLFYYAGHGIESEGKNYLVPVGLSSDFNCKLAKYKCTDVEQVQQLMSSSGQYNKTNIIILDACRNNPCKERAFSQNKWAVGGDIPSGMITCYATSQGQKASDGNTNGNSLYTSALLKYLSQEGLKIEDLFKAVRKELIKQGQEPVETNKLTQDFYFRNAKTKIINDIPTPHLDAASELKNTNSNLKPFRDSTGLYGYYDINSNKVIIPPSFSYCFDFNGSFATVRQKGKFGKINRNGILIAPAIYDAIGDFYENRAYIKYNNKYGFIDESGILRIPFDYDEVDNFKYDRAWVGINDRFGFIDTTGKIIGPIEYEDFSDFYENVAIYADKYEKFGLIDKNGTHITSPVFDDLGEFSNGKAPASLNGKSVLIDTRGNVIETLKYSTIYDFKEGKARVKLNGKFGFIDLRGIEIIPTIYDKAGDFYNGKALVKLNGKYGFINEKGNFIIQPLYDQAENFTRGVAKIQKNGKYGIIDTSGNELIPAIFDHLLIDYLENLLIVELNGKYGVLDFSGKIIIPFDFDSVFRFDYGNAFVTKNGKHGVINSNGKIIVPFIYDETLYEREGFICVKLNNKYGFLDEFGKITITPKYDAASSFFEGLAVVCADSKCGYIDPEGNTIIPFIYDSGFPFISGKAVVTLNGHTMTINKQGICISNCP